MDTEYSLQDVVRCHICETVQTTLHCDVCQKYLCKVHVGEHLSDESKEHKVLPFKKRGLTNTPKCFKHSNESIELYCKHCDIPICVACASSGEHLKHTRVGISEILETKKEAFRRNLQELINFILPEYQEIASNIPDQIAGLMENSEKLTEVIKKCGEDLHREINTMVNRLISDLYEMDSKLLVVLNEQEDVIKHSISEIEQSIADLKKLLDSNDVSLISAFKSKNAEFRSLPPKLTVTLPSFTPVEINNQQISHQFGFLSAFNIKTEERDYKDNFPGADSFPDRPLIDEPNIITNIETEHVGLHCVSCLSDVEIWTCGGFVMKLYNIHGDLEKSVHTKSGNKTRDIAVTSRKELVYTDFNDRTVNIVRNNTQIDTEVRLRGWRPRGVCCTLSGDFLVVLISDDETQTKVVRYSDSTEKQTIQFNDNNQPLFLSGYNNKFISENRNLDICVSDCGAVAGAVVVVNQVGKLRFTYTGPPSTTKESFRPHGITTDSQSRILISDFNKNHIHIIDQDGQFLRYIDNCDLIDPRGLCVDTKDNLFVAEFTPNRVKKIQYCM